MTSNWPRSSTLPTAPARIRLSLKGNPQVPKSTRSGPHRKSDNTGRKRTGASRFWLHGVHPVREALGNPDRKSYRLVVTRNALNRLGEHVPKSGLVPEIVPSRNFPVKFKSDTSHQGCALLVDPLPRRELDRHEFEEKFGQPHLAVFLDRVTDPMNTGAVLRTARTFGVDAVIAPARHSARESGALAKAASGALDRVPYLRVPNLANAMMAASDSGSMIIGLDGSAVTELSELLTSIDTDSSIGVAFGSEGKGLRKRTRDCCHVLARIGRGGPAGSLNVSTSVAITLYAIRTRQYPP